MLNLVEPHVAWEPQPPRAEGHASPEIDMSRESA